VKVGNKQFAAEIAPEGWLMLDHARSHLLPPEPTCFDIFEHADIRAAYEILSRSASDVLKESRILRSAGSGAKAA
jgi:hypothetical protein